MSKRFLPVLCLGIVLTAVLATSAPVLGQGISDPSPPYHIHLHGSFGYNYALWVPGTGTIVTCANIFNVDAEHGQTLEVVAFYTLVKDVNYQVTVVPNYTGPESLEGDGVLAAHGTLAESGYHKIDLDQPIVLDPGTRYAVVLSQSALSRPALATDSARSEAGKRTVSEAGKSFVLLNGAWTDLHTWHPNTAACVQAWTWDREPLGMSVSDMEKDLEFVLDKLRSDHPKVKEHGFTLSQLDVIASVRQSIAVPLQERDFWFQLQRVFAMMTESHTALNRPQWDELYLDLPFRWLMDDGMIIVKDSGSFLKGDQIVSIGGRSPAEILDALWEIRSSENQYWIRYSASYILRQESYLSYLGLVNPDNTVDVEVLRDGETAVYKVPLGRTYSSALPSTVPIEWRIEEDSDLGYFRFDVWPSEAGIGPLTDALSDFFAAVKDKDIGNVVFDWRNAEANYSSIERTLLSYLDTGRVYYSGYNYIGHEKKPSELLFRGNTYVLTSNRTGGSAVIFATTLHDNGIAVTIGEPTSQAAPFPGPKMDNEPLPVTGWTYRLATKIRARPRNIPPEIALFPDIPVYTTRQDIVSGRDAQMEKLREIIASIPEVSVTPIAPPEKPAAPLGNPPPADSPPSYITMVSYAPKWGYFEVTFTEPIASVDSHGITVTGPDGRVMTLRDVNLTPNSPKSLIISPTRAIDNPGSCLITLRAGAVTLSSGRKNGASSFTGEGVSVSVRQAETIDAQPEDWTKGTLPPYIRAFSYVERFHYFIVIFNQPILALDPDGITVTTASGQEMALRYTPNLTNIARDTLTISPRDWVAEGDSCIITLPANAVLLQDGFTNTVTLRLGKYKYHQYP